MGRLEHFGHAIVVELHLQLLVEAVDHLSVHAALEGI